METTNLLTNINNINDISKDWLYPNPSYNVVFLAAICQIKVIGKVYYLTSQSQNIFSHDYKARIDDILSLGIKLKGHLIENIHHVFKNINNNQVNFHKNTINEVFSGLDKTNFHGLNFPYNALGLSLTEPQITKSLQFFLYSNVTNDLALIRTKAFLRALLSGYSQFNDLIKSLCGTKKIEVESEKLTTKGKRIDLLFQWSVNKNNYAVAIEAKFGHKVKKTNFLLIKII